MNRWFAGTLAAFGLATLLASPGLADSVSLITTPTGTDSAQWSQLLSSPKVTSADGVGITLPQSVQVFTNNGVSSWGGNFYPGEYVIWSGNASTITLNFNQGVSEVGAQIEPDAFTGTFTAEVQAYDGSTLLGTYTENGVAAPSDNGSAIFIGVNDASGADITKLVFSTPTVSNYAGPGFAIGALNLDEDPPATSQFAPAVATAPEPATTAMFGGGLLALAFLKLRKRQEQRA